MPLVRPAVLPWTGTDADRLLMAAIGKIKVGELHTTDDGRAFLNNVYLGPIWQGAVATEAAMLALHTSNTVRSCFPGDFCSRTDLTTKWLCVSNRGEAIGDWVEFPNPDLSLYLTIAALTALRGAANGLATLDSGGKLPTAQLPDLAISEYLGTVASDAAMIALSGQRGDWCLRSDVSKLYILSAEPSSTLGNWVSVLYPSASNIQALLDSISTTRGAILYRGASGWAVLLPNTAGFVLTDGGSGADPSWQIASGGSGSGSSDCRDIWLFT